MTGRRGLSTPARPLQASPAPAAAKARHRAARSATGVGVRLGLALALGGGLTGVAAAQGQPGAGAPAGQSAPSATVTNTLSAEYRAEPPGELRSDDHYGVFIDRLNIVGAAGDLSTNARIDTMYFIDPETSGLHDDARVERLQVRYDLGRLELTVGDYFRQIGRGMVLSLRKVDELGIDVTLRGVLAEYNGNDHQGSLFAGRANPANIDMVSQRFLEDTEDILAGGHTRFQLADRVYMGAHGLVMEREDPILPSFGQDRNYTVGGTLELPQIAEWMSFYAESNYQIVERAGEESHRAIGSYAVLDVTPEDWSILVEGIHMMGLDDSTNGFEQLGGINQATQDRFRYNQIPTLERIDMEVGNVEDVMGARLRVERFFLNGDLAVHANGLFKLEDPNEPAEIMVFHGYGGFEYVYGGGASRLTTNGGWRESRRTVNNETFKVVGHYDLDWVQSFGNGWGIHLQSLNQFRRLELGGGEYDDNWRGSEIFSVDRAGFGTLAFEYGFDTQAASRRTHFYSGSYLVNALSWLQLRGTVGTQRGGIKCIAGVCRNFPEFAGARMDIIIKHGLTSF